MNSHRDTQGRFTKAPLSCSIWFERDRANVTLYRGSKEVFSLWDEDLQSEVESGFLTTPPFGERASEAEWLPHLVSYAESAGLL